MPNSGSSTDSQSPVNTKVARIIETYDLTDLDAYLEAAWLGDGVEKKSLRALAREVNYRILESIFDQHAMQTVDGEIPNLYTLLTDEEASVGSRIEAEHRLRELGVDIEQLRRDFVSHQAVHTYLTKSRGISYEAATPSREERIEDRIQMLRRLRTRLEAVTESTIDELLDSIDDVEIISTVSVQCSHCGSSYSLEEYLRSDGCDCERS